jgi:hypothetical protein
MPAKIKQPAKPYRVIICPSGDDEKDERLEKADTYRKVRNLMNKGVLSFLAEYTFETEREREAFIDGYEAFIDGYEATVGWLGDGRYHTDEPKKKEAAT